MSPILPGKNPPSRPTSAHVSSSASAAAEVKPKVKREKGWGEAVPLPEDSDDEFNPHPVTAVGGSEAGTSRAGLHTPAASSSTVKSLKKRSVGSPAILGSGTGTMPLGRGALKPDSGAALPSRTRVSSTASGTGSMTTTTAAGKRKSRGMVDYGKLLHDSEDEQAAADIEAEDDFGRASKRRKAPRGTRLNRQEREALALAGNPLRILAGRSPLSDSDESDATGGSGAYMQDGLLLRGAAAREAREEQERALGAKGAEVIMLSSDTEPEVERTQESESSGESCSSSDDDGDLQAQIERKRVRREAEVRMHGRVLGHRERRRKRRQEAAAMPAAQAMVHDFEEESAESDHMGMSLADIQAAVLRRRAAERAKTAKAANDLAAAGPIVPPPLPLSVRPLATDGVAHAPAEASDTESDSDDGNVIAPRPSQRAQMAQPAIEHRPAFPPPPTQAYFGPLELTAMDDGSGPPAAAVNRYINRQLREYQRDGVRFMWEMYRNGKGGILGDDMGLGKTIQVISFLSAIMGFTGEAAADARRRMLWSDGLRASGRMKDGIHPDNPAPDEKWPTALIIAPSSVCENWIRELETWGYFSVGYYTGKERHGVLREFKRGWYDILVMSLETARNDMTTLYDEHFTVVFVDEVHRVKNPLAMLTKALMKLEHPIRFGLTGTAIQNRFEEFWCILNWARPGEVGTKREWDSFITKPIKHGQAHDASVEAVLQGRVRATQLVSKILPHFFIRRTKALIAHQMPRKTDKVVLCSLTPRQFDCLQRLRNTPQVQHLLHLLTPAVLALDPLEKNQALRFITMFKKVSNHLALILPNPEDDEKTRLVARKTFQTIYPEIDPDEVAAPDMLSFDKELCGKWQALQRLLAIWRPHNQTNENKVLIFSSSVRLLKIIASFLDLDSYEYLFLHGKIPLADRMPMVDRFQSEPKIYIFLISTLAGGVGLNLTAANKVVIFDPSWNPSNDQQAMDRAFRIGQKSDVEVYRLIAAGSIEENIYTRQLYKQQMSSIGYDGRHEKRIFTGVQDDPNRQGELFGLANLFDLREDACRTDDIMSRIRDAELPFESSGAADGFDDDEKGSDLVFNEQDRDAQDVASLLDLGKQEPASENSLAIDRLLGFAGAARIQSDRDVLNQDLPERKLFDECRAFRRKNPVEAKSMPAYKVRAEKKDSPPKKRAKVEQTEDGKPALFVPPPRTKKVPGG